MTTPFRKLRNILYGFDESRVDSEEYAIETDVLLNPKARHFPKSFKFEGITFKLEKGKNEFGLPVLNITNRPNSDVKFSLGMLSATTLYPNPSLYSGSTRAVTIFPIRMNVGDADVSFNVLNDRELVPIPNADNAFGVTMFRVECTLKDVLEKGLSVDVFTDIQATNLEFSRDHMLGNRCFILPFEDSFNHALLFQEDDSAILIAHPHRHAKSHFILRDNPIEITGVVEVRTDMGISVITNDYWNVASGVYSMLLSAIRSPYIMYDDYENVLPGAPREIITLPEPTIIATQDWGTLARVQLEPIKFANELSLTSKTIKYLPPNKRNLPVYQDWLARYKKAPWLGEKCSVCLEPKKQLYLCGACMETVYCSPKCQKRDRLHTCLQE